MLSDFLNQEDFRNHVLVVEVVDYVLGSDYTKYMNIQEQIHFRIYEEFEKRKIEFAYPTQTFYLSKIPQS
ncbi:MAG: hypothetical protein ACXW4I_04840 [Candidatus Deferrimicrobiaceae bacterium]